MCYANSAGDSRTFWAAHAQCAARVPRSLFGGLAGIRNAAQQDYVITGRCGFSPGSVASWYIGMNDTTVEAGSNRAGFGQVQGGTPAEQAYMQTTNFWPGNLCVGGTCMWNPGEPNDIGGEDAVQAVVGGAGVRLNDIAVTNSFQYCCEARPFATPAWTPLLPPRVSSVLPAPNLLVSEDAAVGRVAGSIQAVFPAPLSVGLSDQGRKVQYALFAGTATLPLDVGRGALQLAEQAADCTGLSSCITSGLQLLALDPTTAKLTIRSSLSGLWPYQGADGLPFAVQACDSAVPGLCSPPTRIQLSIAPSARPELLLAVLPAAVAHSVLLASSASSAAAARLVVAGMELRVWPGRDLAFYLLPAAASVAPHLTAAIGTVAMGDSSLATVQCGAAPLSPGQIAVLLIASGAEPADVVAAAANSSAIICAAKAALQFDMAGSSSTVDEADVPPAYTMTDASLDSQLIVSWANAAAPSVSLPVVSVTLPPLLLRVTPAAGLVGSTITVVAAGLPFASIAEVGILAVTPLGPAASNGNLGTSAGPVPFIASASGQRVAVGDSNYTVVASSAVPCGAWWPLLAGSGSGASGASGDDTMSLQCKVPPAPTAVQLGVAQAVVYVRLVDGGSPLDAKLPKVPEAGSLGSLPPLAPEFIVWSGGLFAYPQDLALQLDWVTGDGAAAVPSSLADASPFSPAVVLRVQEPRGARLDDPAIDISCTTSLLPNSTLDAGSGSSGSAPRFSLAGAATAVPARLPVALARLSTDAAAGSIGDVPQAMRSMTDSPSLAFAVFPVGVAGPSGSTHALTASCQLQYLGSVRRFTVSAPLSVRLAPLRALWTVSPPAAVFPSVAGLTPTAPVAMDVMAPAPVVSWTAVVVPGAPLPPLPAALISASSCTLRTEALPGSSSSGSSASTEVALVGQTACSMMTAAASGAGSMSAGVNCSAVVGNVTATAAAVAVASAANSTVPLALDLWLRNSCAVALVANCSSSIPALAACAAVNLTASDLTAAAALITSYAAGASGSGSAASSGGGSCSFPRAGLVGAMGSQTAVYASCAWATGETVATPRSAVKLASLTLVPQSRLQGSYRYNVPTNAPSFRLLPLDAAEAAVFARLALADSDIACSVEALTRSSPADSVSSLTTRLTLDAGTGATVTRPTGNSSSGAASTFLVTLPPLRLRPDYRAFLTEAGTLASPLPVRVSIACTLRQQALPSFSDDLTYRNVTLLWGVAGSIPPSTPVPMGAASIALPPQGLIASSAAAPVVPAVLTVSLVDGDTGARALDENESSCELLCERAVATSGAAVAADECRVFGTASVRASAGVATFASWALIAPQGSAVLLQIACRRPEADAPTLRVRAWSTVREVRVVIAAATPVVVNGSTAAALFIEGLDSLPLALRRPLLLALNTSSPAAGSRAALLPRNATLHLFGSVGGATPAADGASFVIAGAGPVHAAPSLTVLHGGTGSGVLLMTLLYWTWPSVNSVTGALLPGNASVSWLDAAAAPRTTCSLGLVDAIAGGSSSAGSSSSTSSSSASASNSAATSAGLFSLGGSSALFTAVPIGNVSEVRLRLFLRGPAGEVTAVQALCSISAGAATVMSSALPVSVAGFKAVWLSATPSIGVPSTRTAIYAVNGDPLRLRLLTTATSCRVGENGVPLSSCSEAEFPLLAEDATTCEVPSDLDAFSYSLVGGTVVQDSTSRSSAQAVSSGPLAAPVTSAEAAIGSVGLIAPLKTAVAVLLVCRRDGNGPVTSLNFTVVLAGVAVRWLDQPPPWILFGSSYPVAVQVGLDGGEADPAARTPLRAASYPGLAATCMVRRQLVSGPPGSVIMITAAASVEGDLGMSNLTFAINAPPGSVLSLDAECSIFGSPTRTPAVMVTIDTVVPYLAAPLPPLTWLPSSVSQRIPLDPPPLLRLRRLSDGADLLEQEATCRASLQTSFEPGLLDAAAAVGLDLRAAAAARVASSIAQDLVGSRDYVFDPLRGGISIYPLPLLASWGESVVVGYRCTRAGVNALPEINHTVTMRVVRQTWRRLPSAQAVSKQALPLAVQLQDLPVMFAGARPVGVSTSRVFNESAASVACRVDSPAESGSTGKLLLERNSALVLTPGAAATAPSATVTAAGGVNTTLVGTAVFPELSLTGQAGRDFELAVTCTLGDTQLPNELRANVTMSGCPEGSQPVGYDLSTCDQCNDGFWSAGGTMPCVRCPAVGVDCTGGKLSLLSGFSIASSAGAVTHYVSSLPGKLSASALAALGRAPAPAGNSSTAADSGARRLSLSAFDSEAATFFSISTGSGVVQLPTPEALYNASLSLYGGRELISVVIDSSTQLHECPQSSACIVDTHLRAFGCAEGHTGLLCAECEENNGWVKSGSSCVQCLPSAANISLLFLGGLVILAVLSWIALRINFKTTSDGRVVWRLAVTFVSSIGALTLYQAKGSTAWVSIVGVAQMVLLPGSSSTLSLSPLQCETHLSWFARYYAALSMPIIVAAACLIINVVFITGKGLLSCWRIRSLKNESRHGGLLGQLENESRERRLAEARAYSVPQEMRSLWSEGRFLSILMFTSFLLYPSITGETVSVYRCVQIGDGEYLESDLSISCSDGPHRLARAIGGLVIGVFVVGLPVLLALFLWRNSALVRQGSQAAGFWSKFSFLLQGLKVHRPTGFAYESVVMARKALLVLIPSVVRDSYVQSILASMVLMTSVLVHLSLSPYVRRLFSRLESASLMCLALTMGISVIYQRSSDLAAAAASAAASLTSATAAAASTGGMASNSTGSASSSGSSGSGSGGTASTTGKTVVILDTAASRAASSLPVRLSAEATTGLLVALNGIMMLVLAYFFFTIRAREVIAAAGVRTTKELVRKTLGAVKRRASRFVPVGGTGSLGRDSFRSAAASVASEGTVAASDGADGSSSAPAGGGRRPREARFEQRPVPTTLLRQGMLGKSSRLLADVSPSQRRLAGVGSSKRMLDIGTAPPADVVVASAADAEADRSADADSAERDIDGSATLGPAGESSSAAANKPLGGPSGGERGFSKRALPLATRGVSSRALAALSAPDAAESKAASGSADTATRSHAAAAAAASTALATASGRLGRRIPASEAAARLGGHGAALGTFSSRNLLHAGSRLRRDSASTRGLGIGSGASGSHGAELVAAGAAAGSLAGISNPLISRRLQVAAGLAQGPGSAAAISPSSRFTDDGAAEARQGANSSTAGAAGMRREKEKDVLSGLGFGAIISAVLTGTVPEHVLAKAAANVSSRNLVGAASAAAHSAGVGGLSAAGASTVASNAAGIGEAGSWEQRNPLARKVSAGEMRGAASASAGSSRMLVRSASKVFPAAIGDMGGAASGAVAGTGLGLRRVPSGSAGSSAAGPTAPSSYAPPSRQPRLTFAQGSGLTGMIAAGRRVVRTIASPAASAAAGAPVSSPVSVSGQHRPVGIDEDDDEEDAWGMAVSESDGSDDTRSTAGRRSELSGHSAADAFGRGSRHGLEDDEDGDDDDAWSQGSDDAEAADEAAHRRAAREAQLAARKPEEERGTANPFAAALGTSSAVAGAASKAASSTVAAAAATAAGSGGARPVITSRPVPGTLVAARAAVFSRRSQMESSLASAAAAAAAAAAASGSGASVVAPTSGSVPVSGSVPGQGNGRRLTIMRSLRSLWDGMGLTANASGGDGASGVSSSSSEETRAAGTGDAADETGAAGASRTQRGARGSIGASSRGLFGMLGPAPSDLMASAAAVGVNLPSAAPGRRSSLVSSPVPAQASSASQAAAGGGPAVAAARSPVSSSVSIASSRGGSAAAKSQRRLSIASGVRRGTASSAGGPGVSDSARPSYADTGSIVVASAPGTTATSIAAQSPGPEA